MLWGKMSATLTGAKTPGIRKRATPLISEVPLNRLDTAALWDLRLCSEPGGPTSITSTARFVLTIFYIVNTPLSGHTTPRISEVPVNPDNAVPTSTPTDCFAFSCLRAPTSRYS
jgi:hypothetical protein